MKVSDALARSRLIAIVRGIVPEEVVAVAGALRDAGFAIVEVPLNSPRPFDSIRRIAEAFGHEMLVGAGTVLTPADVAEVAACGGRLIVAPNFDPAVVAATKQHGLLAAPGVGTATEAFAALAAGADILKFFPAEIIPPAAIKALRAVLPITARVAPVGGITPNTLAPYHAAGADAFGIGSALYRPGKSLADVAHDARLFRAAETALPQR